MPAFVHLDVLSCASLYASPSTAEEYVEALAGKRSATRSGAPTTPAALALADYNLAAAVQLARACRARAITPITGLRARVVPERAFRPWNEQPGDLILLAPDETGWGNLVTLNNLGHVAGATAAGPRVDWHDLAAHAGGLLCLTGAPDRGIIARVLEQGDEVGFARAIALVQRLRALYPHHETAGRFLHGLSARGGNGPGAPWSASRPVFHTDRDQCLEGMGASAHRADLRARSAARLHGG